MMRRTRTTSTMMALAMILLISNAKAYISETLRSSSIRTTSGRTGCVASSTALFMAKKRGMRLDRDVIGTSPGTGGNDAMSSGSSNSRSTNWRPLPPSVSNPATAIPSQMDKVALLETQLPSLTNSATNPTGAVAVVRHGSKTYCFDSACPSCKIPLTKAKVLEQQAPPSDSSQKSKVLLSCDFCTATYDLASGARVEKPAKGGGGGLFSGVVSNIMAADPRSAGPLRLYKLGQQGGKLMISID